VAREIARQNALAAMELALWELGPSLRRGDYVTASAANGVRAGSNGNWTGLWRVEEGKAIFDRWLLSVPLGQVRDPTLPDRFRGESLAIFADRGQGERCPLRTIERAGRRLGRYGFRVEDENAKLCIGGEGGENDGERDGEWRPIRDLAAGWRRLFPWLDGTCHCRSELWRSGIPSELLSQVTWDCWSLRQNTEGSWLCDISAKIFDQNFDPEEFLFPPRAGFPPPPTFAMLAAHFQRPPQGGAVDAAPGGPYLRQRYPCLAQVPPAEEEKSQLACAVHPVLCGHWLTVGAERRQGEVRISAVPVIALWNPLAVAIRPHRFSLELRSVESPDRPNPSYLPRLLVRSQGQPQGQVVSLGDGATGTIFFGPCTAGWAPGEVKFFSPDGWRISPGGAMVGEWAEGWDRGGWEVALPLAGSGPVALERLWSPVLHRSRWDGLTLRLWDGDCCVQEVADFSDDVPAEPWTVALGRRLLLFQLSAVLRAGTGAAGDCRWLANYNPRAQQIRRSAYEHFPLAAVPAQLFCRHFAPWRVQFVELPSSPRPTPLPTFFADRLDRAIVFGYPTAIESLASLGQIPITPFSYHPAIALGNSWAPPLLPRDRTHQLALPPSGQGAEYFHRECRMDYAYLLNEAFYDHYFAEETGKKRPGWTGEAAGRVRRGGFNVNGATADGWRLLLRCLPYDELRRVYRVERFPGQRHLSGSCQAAPTLSDAELDRLAECIAAEVCRRGPFARLSQFVNRSLGSASDPSTRRGALQAALEAVQLRHFPDLRADDRRDREWFDGEAAAGDSNAGAPGDLSQADLLHYLGNALTVRGDTFSLRSYGEGSGQPGMEKTLGALAEALVRRLPDGSLELVRFRWLESGDFPAPCDPESGENPANG
jgi:hypothetical protein